MPCGGKVPGHSAQAKLLQVKFSSESATLLNFKFSSKRDFKEGDQGFGRAGEQVFRRELVEQSPEIMVDTVNDGTDVYLVLRLCRILVPGAV